MTKREENEITEGEFLSDVSDEDLVRAGLFGDVKRNVLHQKTDEEPEFEFVIDEDESEEEYPEDDEPGDEDESEEESDPEDVETDDDLISIVNDSEEEINDSTEEEPEEEFVPDAIDLVNYGDPDSPIVVNTGKDSRERKNELRLLDPGDTENAVIDGSPAVIVREKPDKEYQILLTSHMSEDEKTEELKTEDESEEESEEEYPEEEETKEESDPGDENYMGGFEEESEETLPPKKKWFKNPKMKKLVDSTEKFKSYRKPKTEVPPKRKPSDNPDPDSLSERMRRAKLIRSGKYVVLRTLSRDSATGDYIRETTLVPKSELPVNAVQCTNEKGIYCVDKIGNSEWYYRNHVRNAASLDSQFTARDAALYMMSNKIDNALAVRWTEFSHIDPMKFALPLIGVLAIVMIILMR